MCCVILHCLLQLPIRYNSLLFYPIHLLGLRNPRDCLIREKRKKKKERREKGSITYWMLRLLASEYLWWCSKQRGHEKQLRISSYTKRRVSYKIVYYTRTLLSYNRIVHEHYTLPPGKNGARGVVVCACVRFVSVLFASVVVWSACWWWRRWWLVGIVKRKKS